MTRRITTVAARAMPYPREAAVEALWQIENIELTEVKADRVQVQPESASKGTYKVHGRFAGIPWDDQFAYELNDGGFHSRNAGVPPDRATIEGGFVVTPLAGGCTVIHYEQYVVPTRLALLKPLIRTYLRWSMHRELQDLERLIASRPLSATRAA
jgi:hypothetical protein